MIRAIFGDIIGSKGCRAAVRCELIDTAAASGESHAWSAGKQKN